MIRNLIRGYDTEIKSYAHRVHVVYLKIKKNKIGEQQKLFANLPKNWAAVSWAAVQLTNKYPSRLILMHV